MRPVPLFALLVALGCTPEGGGDGQGPVNVGIDGGGGGSGGGGTLPTGDMGSGGSGGAEVDPDDGVLPPDGGARGDGGGEECVPPEQRCVDEGQAFYQRCRGDGRWAIEACPEGELCFNGSCAPDPGSCEEGQVVCLDAQQPGRCVPGEGWEPLERCVGDQRCIDGACAALACAEAAAQRSYLGCDYLAVELPNAAHRADGEGTTPDSPVGVVVANPDFGNSVFVTVADAHGNLANLVPQRNVPLPPIPEIQGRYPQATVRSEVRDGAGMVVDMNVQQADRLEIPAGGLATLLLPRGGAPEMQSSVRLAAFRITTDRPVAAYQFSPYCCNYSFSNDASLLFPVSSLGTDYRYLGVPTWVSLGAPEGSPAGITVVAATDDTEVTIDLPANAAVRADRTNRMQTQGRRITARLAAQEVLQLNSADGQPFSPQPDLSGARISANAPVAVFSTHMCTFYPELNAACDHLEEQLFPTGTWGQVFSLVPPVRRGQGGGGGLFGPGEKIYWKIIARDPGTRVTFSVPFDQLDPVEPGFGGVPNCRQMLANGDLVLDGDAYCEFGTFSPVQISADGPLMVMGIISGQESTGVAQAFGAAAGDPAIFLVPPDHQYRNDYPFLAPDTYANDYLTVVATRETQVFLDEQPVNLADAIAVPGSERVYKHIEISDGPHRVTGDQPFGIMVFAFDDFVSYAFTGGLNLEKR